MSSSMMIPLAGGAALALAFGAHCALMCGPVAMMSAKSQRSGVFSYLIGRVVSYGVLGLLAGGLGQVLFASSWARWVEGLSAFVLAAMLVFCGVRQLSPRVEKVVTLRRGPRTSWLGGVLARLADEPLLLGAATALLPCGALFSVVAAAAALGTPFAGALLMTTFAILTGGVLAGVRGLTAKLVGAGLSRRVLAVLFFVGAGVTFTRAFSTFSSPVPACHAHAQEGVSQHAGNIP